MKIESLFYDNNKWSYEEENINDKKSVQLVLTFGDTDAFASSEHYEYLKTLYPNADIVGSSSSGNVLGAQVSEKSIVASAIEFDSSSVSLNVIDFNEGDDLFDVATQVVSNFSKEHLQSIFIISDGLHMNGATLAQAIHKELPNVLVTGGLAGDGARFEKTLILANDVPKERRIVAIAFYGEKLHVSSGCYAGWSEFGTQRVITKSEANVVYEIDGEPALALYKKYLGAEAVNLPSSGLRFPLSIQNSADDKSIIRTLLAVDEEKQSLTFAGDVPQGSLAKLMKTDIDGLIEGSEHAAKEITTFNKENALGLVVSCVGRRLVMKDLTDEELEIIEDTIGSNVHLTGFYSYGELAPFSSDILNCQLHNQTMTLTVLYED